MTTIALIKIKLLLRLNLTHKFAAIELVIIELRYFIPNKYNLKNRLNLFANKFIHNIKLLMNVQISNQRINIKIKFQILKSNHKFQIKYLICLCSLQGNLKLNFQKKEQNNHQYLKLQKLVYQMTFLISKNDLLITKINYIF